MNYDKSKITTDSVWWCKLKKDTAIELMQVHRLSEDVVKLLGPSEDGGINHYGPYLIDDIDWVEHRDDLVPKCPIQE